MIVVKIFGEKKVCELLIYDKYKIFNKFFKKFQQFAAVINQKSKQLTNPL